MISARSIIVNEYGYHSKNFMTPRVLECGKIAPHLAYELSTGEGLRAPGQQRANQIWGVSVVEYDRMTGNTLRRTDLSGAFQRKSAAEAYIALMKLSPPEAKLEGGK